MSLSHYLWGLALHAVAFLALALVALAGALVHNGVLALICIAGWIGVVLSLRQLDREYRRGASR